MRSCLCREREGKAWLERNTVKKKKRHTESGGGKKMLIKKNSGQKESNCSPWKRSEFSLPESPGLSDEIERLGHSLSKPFQFSLVWSRQVEPDKKTWQPVSTPSSPPPQPSFIRSLHHSVFYFASRCFSLLFFFPFAPSTYKLSDNFQYGFIKQVTLIEPLCYCWS